MRSPTASWSAVSVGSATAAFRLSAAVAKFTASVCLSSQFPRRTGWEHTAADLRQTEGRLAPLLTSGISGKSGTHSNRRGTARALFPARALLPGPDGHGETPGTSSFGSVPGSSFQFDAVAAGVGSGALSRREAPQRAPTSFSSLVTNLRIAPLCAGDGEDEAGVDNSPLLKAFASASSVPEVAR